jgi:hypothetical protein
VTATTDKLREKSSVNWNLRFTVMLLVRMMGIGKKTRIKSVTTLHVAIVRS